MSSTEGSTIAYELDPGSNGFTVGQVQTTTPPDTPVPHIPSPCNNTTDPTIIFIDECLRNRHWHWFLLSSIVTFAAGLVCIIIGRICTNLLTSQRSYVNRPKWQILVLLQKVNHDIKWMTKSKYWCQELISAQGVVGKTLVTAVCALSLGSMAIYFVDASSNKVEDCDLIVTQHVDLAFNFCFLMYFFIRFIAAEDKLLFWMELFSLVDFFTIPPQFVSMYFKRTWLGLRFLRVVRIMNFPDILQYLQVITTSNKIKMGQLGCTVITVWLAGAGFVHLVENSGDPFYDFSNPHHMTFWECAYFILVTMSTVGYGDLYCETVIGRSFMVIFIGGALAMFATFIPEIIECIDTNKWGGSYTAESGMKHVVVCGCINYQTVSNFLKDFLHEDRENVQEKIIFIDSLPPELELQALFKRYFTRVCFFKGSVINMKDLGRVKMKQAQACLILANKQCEDPDAEDMGNIMRIISIKNYCEDIRIIVQLMQYQNKAYLMNIPGWDWDQGDDVVCLSELKLGFLAQSCLAPGFSTLMANLFSMRAYKTKLWGRNFEPWEDEYLQGAGMEMYTEMVSDSFIGLTFAQAAVLCYCKLNLLLIAIEAWTENNSECALAINPGPDIKIKARCRAYVIGQSDDEAKRITYYCTRCHKETTKAIDVIPCGCKDTRKSLATLIMSSASVMTNGGILNAKPPPRLRTLLKRSYSTVSQQTVSSSNDFTLHQGSTFDVTYTLHFSKNREFSEACLTRDQAKELKFDQHIVLCLLADTNSPLMGLGNFVMPLRASNLHRQELKSIVLVGSGEYIEKEWPALRNFPLVYVLNSSPLNRASLRAININKTSMCVILSTKQESTAKDQMLVDKETILCSLNIRAMRFRGEGTTSVLSRIIETLSAIGATELSQGVKSGAEIPILCELRNDTNVYFLNPEDEDSDDKELFISQPFACGTAFAISVLDSLMSTTYFNNSALTILRSFVTGGATPELEQLLAETDGAISPATNEENIENRYRCRMTQLSLEQPPLNKMAHCETFGELFVESVSKLGILCLGLYRLLSPVLDSARSCEKRYVITNPSAALELHGSDLVFCVQPFDETNLVTVVSPLHAQKNKPFKPPSKPYELPRQPRPPSYTDLQTSGRTHSSIDESSSFISQDTLDGNKNQQRNGKPRKFRDPGTGSVGGHRRHKRTSGSSLPNAHGERQVDYKHLQRSDTDRL